MSANPDPINRPHDDHPFFKVIIDAFRNGKKMLIAGNGGSAADAEHIAAELVGKFRRQRPALPAIALTTNTAVLTAIGNDYGFECVFSRQIEALGQEGDILLVLSTSGNSPNILKAIDAAYNKEMIVIGFTGDAGGDMRDRCHFCMRAPFDNVPDIQEAHMLMGHILCGAIEEALYG